MTVVLDSWAILRLLEGTEPAVSRVHVELDGDVRPVMSWINLGEVFYVVRRLHRGEEAESVERDLRPQLDLDLPDASRVLEAATIKAHHACGYAAAFAAATALAHQKPSLTGDPELLLAGAPWAHEDLRNS
ncbi:MAG: PIN domain-containing protein [Nitriliruptoraceae bacterium]